MITTINQILREVEGLSASMGEGRRLVFERGLALNGVPVFDMFAEIEVKDGDVLSRGKHKQWIFQAGKWNPQV